MNLLKLLDLFVDILIDGLIFKTQNMHVTLSFIKLFHFCEEEKIITK